MDDRDESGGTQHGVVTSIGEDKGYGFIRGDDEVDRFFHVSAVYDPPLHAGDHVSFQAIDHPKGERAIEVRRVPRAG